MYLKYNKKNQLKWKHVIIKIIGTIIEIQFLLPIEAPYTNQYHIIHIDSVIKL